MTSPRSIRWCLALFAATVACKFETEGEAHASESSSGGTDSGDPTGDPTGMQTTVGSTTMGSTTATTATTTSASTTMGTSDPTTDTTDPDSTGNVDTGPAGDAIYEADFAGNDGEDWPSPWEVVGVGIIEAELDGGRGRLAGATMHTSRIALPGFDETDVDIYVTVTFDDPSAQGFGFYCRQNGGALTDTDPPGQGYAVFFEGAYMRAIGVWREIDGVEQLIGLTPDAVPGGLAGDVPYRIRFQCRQNGETTNLRAKVWPVGEDEPADWRVSHDDPTPQLQNLSGSFAADIYNYAGTGSLYVDDIWIAAL